MTTVPTYLFNALRGPTKTLQLMLSVFNIYGKLFVIQIFRGVIVEFLTIDLSVLHNVLYAIFKFLRRKITLSANNNDLYIIILYYTFMKFN